MEKNKRNAKNEVRPHFTLGAVSVCSAGALPLLRFLYMIAKKHNQLDAEEGGGREGRSGGGEGVAGVGGEPSE